MADNATLPATGASVAADDISSVLYQRVKLIHGADGTNDGDVSTANPLPVRSMQVTCTTDVTRPANTTAYAVNDAWSDSTSAPTSGGFTFTSAARVSGGSGVITDAIVASSNNPGTLLQGEIWLFDTSVTNINDNSAFSITDSEVKTVVGVIPFTLGTNNLNSIAHVQNLSIGFTCSGSANLRFLVKVKNAYTPASAEVLTCRLKILQN